MPVTAFRDQQSIEALAPAWNEIYRCDPQAHFFSSWDWRACVFHATPYDPLVLAYQPQSGGDYVAILPLLVQHSSGNMITTLHLGDPPHVHYSGFLCMPGYEAEALPALAAYLQRTLQWDRFQIHFALDPRLDVFLESFTSEQYRIARHQWQAPYIDLPDSWDKYLKKRLSRSTRKSIKRSIRRIEELPGFHKTVADAGNLEQHIDILLDLYHDRWGPIFPQYRHLLPLAFARQRLWLSILWQDDTPIAAEAALLDREKNVFVDCLGAHNPAYASNSPGNVSITNAVEYAIQHGYQVFDFLSGNNPYKYSLGAENRSSTTLFIIPKNLKTRAIGLMRSMRRMVKGEVTSEWDI